MKMGWECSPCQGGKRIRSAEEDEVFLDNYHTQKRYLSEVMAHSFDGLKVEESYAKNVGSVTRNFDFIESPAHIDAGKLSRSALPCPTIGEELSTIDSPMSDDSDESIGFRFGHYQDTLRHTLSSPVSPASPCKTVRNSASSGNPSIAGSATANWPFPYSKPYISDAGSRFPPSPSDPCHSGDLRRAALLRSVQIRTHSPHTSYTVSADDGIELAMQSPIEDVEQSSPGSLPLPFRETSPETDQTNVFPGSPVHGIFPSQVGRSSSLVRSLLMDESINSASRIIPDNRSSAFNINPLKPEVLTDDLLKFKKSDNYKYVGSMDRSMNRNGRFTGMLRNSLTESSKK